MRLFLIECGVDIEKIVNPTFKYQLNKDSDIAHAALVLDQTIFGSRQTVDWVLFSKQEDVKYYEFLSMEKYIPADSRTIFSASNNELNCFYCRPAMFPILGNMNKTNDPIYFMLSRLRIDIQWI